MSAPQQATGMVLHARRFRENSRIVEWFTREAGRVATVARVPRRRAAATLAALQPFREALLHWRGGGELVTLTGLDAGRHFPLAGEAQVCGLYCNELLLRLTRRGLPQPALYGAWRDTLAALAAGGAPAPLLRAFEWQLLTALGYGLHPERDSETGAPLEPGRPCHYHPAHGFTARPLASGSLTVAPATLAALQRRDWTAPGQAAALRRLLGRAIDHLLEGRPLRSRALLRALTRYRTGEPPP